jgi:hypothetical protein
MTSCQHLYLNLLRALARSVYQTDADRYFKALDQTISCDHVKDFSHLRKAYREHLETETQLIERLDPLRECYDWDPATEVLAGCIDRHRRELRATLVHLLVYHPPVGVAFVNVYFTFHS